MPVQMPRQPGPGRSSQIQPDVVAVGTQHPVEDPGEILGVNDRVHLAAAETVMRRRVNERWMREGVTMVDPEATYVEVGVELAPDVRLLPGTFLEGRTTVAEGAVIEESIVMDHTLVGRGARLRRVIADRYNVIADHDAIGVDLAKDAQLYQVDPSGVVVLPRGLTRYAV